MFIAEKVVIPTELHTHTAGHNNSITHIYIIYLKINIQRTHIFNFKKYYLLFLTINFSEISHQTYPLDYYYFPCNV